MRKSWQFLSLSLNLKGGEKVHGEAAFPLASLCVLYQITANLGSSSTSSDIYFIMQKKMKLTMNIDKKYIYLFFISYFIIYFHTAYPSYPNHTSLSLSLVMTKFQVPFFNIYQY